MKPVLTCADGATMPRLGQGTWYLGEKPSAKQSELKALRTGIESGLTLIDTAEMYGEGLAETLVGEAIAPYDRESLFLVSKVYPWNAGEDRIFRACESTLRRMKIFEVSGALLFGLVSGALVALAIIPFINYALMSFGMEPLTLFFALPLIG